MVERNQGQGDDEANGINDVVFLSAQLWLTGENAHGYLHGQNGQ